MSVTTESNVATVTPLPFEVQEDHVAVYRDGKWQSVLKTSEDFPISIKMVITPEFASDVMEHRNRLNRPINARRVNKYGRDILAGNFHVINNGIAFYEDGSLADAQHRLSAIAKTGIPVTCFVIFGMTRAAGKAIDDGRPRSDRDVAHLSGLQLPPTFVSTANFMIEQMGLQYARSEKIDFYEKHKEAITCVVNNLTKKYVCRAPIMAVIARAWYTQDRGRLIEFMDVLQTGKMLNEKEDEAAFRLREYSIDNGSRNDGPFRTKLYEKTTSALRDFLARKSIIKLSGTSEQLFGLPEEIQMKKDKIFQNRSEASKQARDREKRLGTMRLPNPSQMRTDPSAYGG